MSDINESKFGQPEKLLSSQWHGLYVSIQNKVDVPRHLRSNGIIWKYNNISSISNITIKSSCILPIA